MICVIITVSGSDKFELFDEAILSRSFLPASGTGTVLSNMYSVLNTYFSRDKIYVVCSKEENKHVLKSINGIEAKNILVEPKKISYTASIYYASLILQKIAIEDRVFFIPADRFFKKDSRISEWFNTLEKGCTLGNFIFPIEYFEKKNDDKETSRLIVEAGKLSYTDQKNMMYRIETVNLVENNVKRRKIFGKQGKLLYSVSGYINDFIESQFFKDHLFFKELKKVMTSNDLSWLKIVEHYASKSDGNSNFFAEIQGFYCIFVDVFATELESWTDYKSKYMNFVRGDVSVINCSRCVIINLDDKAVHLENLKDIVFVKNNDMIFCKSIN